MKKESLRAVEIEKKKKEEIMRKKELRKMQRVNKT
jgi:hypothetical protein